MSSRRLLSGKTALVGNESRFCRSKTRSFRIWDGLGCRLVGTLSGKSAFVGNEESPKRHAVFSDTDYEDEVKLSLKSQSETCWSCRWESVKAVVQQASCIVKTSVVLVEDNNAKITAMPERYLDPCAILFLC